MAFSATYCALSIYQEFIARLTFHLQKFDTLAKQQSENQDPLHRLFSREGAIGRKLLGQVKKDLNDVAKVCEGELKQTNHLRTLMSSLTKGKHVSPPVSCHG